MEEWAMLDTNQRKMFRDVMLENISHLVFMGYQICISEVLSQSEQGELWREGLRFLQVWSPGRENDHKKAVITIQHISKDTSTNQTKQISHTEEGPLESNDFGEYFTHSTMTDMGKTPNVNKQFQRVLNYHSFLHQNKKIQTGCKSYNCHLCGKVFRSSSGLRQPEKIHTREKPYGYHLSGKDFTGSSTLRQHERIHTVEDPYFCHLCGNSFSQSFNLRQHERIQNMEKLYACHGCGKDFTDSTSLRQHERTHTEVKAYVCHVCGKDFTDSSTHRQHERTNTGEKPYVCNMCGKSFIQSGILRQHERIHTGEKPNICNICGKSFSHSDSASPGGDYPLGDLTPTTMEVATSGVTPGTLPSTPVTSFCGISDTLPPDSPPLEGPMTTLLQSTVTRHLAAPGPKRCKEEQRAANESPWCGSKPATCESSRDVRGAQQLATSLASASTAGPRKAEVPCMAAEERKRKQFRLLHLDLFNCYCPAAKGGR
ncbi:putative zinc finger protein 705E [Choloepus didactylus]|uniref:putative zinc finger protein 705E n=1 Tax=Choloepus didactylus TaxID=27675 RepID=UPI00189E84C1|nr:putative zinc finger protein 705E [Choloepus didactylus]